MEQSASDYQNYFLNSFKNNLKELLNYLQEKIPNEDNEHKNIEKILGLYDKLNFEKIIKKCSENSELIEKLLLFSKNSFDIKFCESYLNRKEKYWTVIPSFQINNIFKVLPGLEEREYIFKKLNDIHICSVTYIKVVDEISNCEDGKEFNPFNSIGNNVDNIDVETLFKGIETKNISAYEMIMKSIINEQMDNKMDDYLNNIKEDDVNDAASRLNDVLDGDNFNSSKQTTNILKNMLGNIKDEVVNLKNTGNQLDGKKGVESLMGIAQKVAGNMMNTINHKDVNVLDIWDATSSLAKNTVKSDALDTVDALIRSNIQANLNNANQNNANSTNVNSTTQNPTMSNKEKEREKKKNKNKNKNKK